MKIRTHEKFNEILTSDGALDARQLDALEGLVAADQRANWVVNLGSNKLTASDLVRLTHIAQRHLEHGMSFVVVVNEGDHAYWEAGELVVTPDLDTALQYVEMDEIQRQLDL